MRACLKTTGQFYPKVGLRVRVDGLVYLVTEAEEPTFLDGLTTLTEVLAVPADAGRGPTILNCEVVE